MRYYMDCEFIEDGHTIDLVSIGIVAEDGRELYLQSVEFKSASASEWVQDNVFPNLSVCPHANVTTDSRRPYVQDLHYHRNKGQCIFSGPDKRIIGAHADCPWRTRNQLAHEVFVFMDVKKYGKPEIWTYYGAYDHVAFCQLFGTMMDLPDGYPMYTRDIMQWCEALGSPSLPEQSNVDHNALHDARWNRRAWDYLKMIENGKGYLVGEEEPEIIGNGDRELLMSATMLDGSNYKQVIHFPHEGIRFIPPNPAFGYLEIVRAVAEKDSTYEYAGVYYCPYCDASQVREASSSSDKELSKLFPHDADCIVFLARAMVENMPHEEKVKE